MVKARRWYIFVVLCLSFNSYAIDPTRPWFSFETEHFIIHFNSENKSVASKAAAYAEKAHKNLTKKLNWQPEDKTHLVISDETDISNGYATPYTFNRSVLFISQPDYPNSLEDYDDWLELLIFHEYTHILHLDKNKGVVSGLRDIFGRHLLLFPNFFQPPWLIEGIGTQMETFIGDDDFSGTGRGQSSYFKMMMRMEVASGIKPVSQVNLPFRSWPGRASAYLYGVYFYMFLDEVYGKEAVSGLIDAYSNHIVPFMINSNAKNVLDKDISILWKEYTDWLNVRFEKQINRIEKQGVVEGAIVKEHGYFTDQIKSDAKGNLYYIRHDPYQHAMLMQLTVDGTVKEVIEVHSNSRLDIHESQGVLLAQPEYCDNYNLNYDLFIYSSADKNKRKITSCGRYRSAVWSADGQEIIAVHINGGVSELHLLDEKGNKKQLLWKSDAEIVIGQPDWSNDSRYLLASVFRKESGWNIEQFDIQQRQWLKITSDKAIDVYPVYINNDRSILFSSERNGTYNIYQFNIKEEALQQLTNVTGGAFKSTMLNNDLYYVGYAENGNDIYKLENAQAIKIESLEKQEYTHSLNEIDIKEPDFEVRGYSPWNSIKPQWWEPVIFIEEEKSEVGFATAGHDALAMHNYFLSLAYDSKNQLLTGGASYSYIDRFVIGVSRDSSILSDLAGGYAATISEDDYFLYWLNPLINYESSWNTIVGIQHGVNKEHKREPWILPINDFEDKQAGIAVLFNNTKNYLRSISEADGRDVRLVYENSDIWNSDYTGEVYTLDWREFLQIENQHVLAVRLAEGWGTDTPENFRLGGEDNDYKLLDFLNLQTEELFGKREYTLRGYPEGLPQLTGRRMQLASIEWRFPLGLVERGLMAPPVGLIQWAGSMFMETGAAWDQGHSPDTYYSSMGFELHADVNLFYRLDTRMRLGFASGLDDAIGEDRVYFSLGASF